MESYSVVLLLKRADLRKIYNAGQWVELQNMF